jgi:PadR family transcriptional regulator, regulatory protein PadR
MARNMLGNSEYLVLAGVAHHARGVHGTALLDLLEQRTRREWSVGAVYTTLERLKDKGYVDAQWGEATAERGGRRKKSFRITAAGIRALQASQEARDRMAWGTRDVRPQEA